MGFASATSTQMIRKRTIINLTLHFFIAGFCKKLSLPWNKVPIIHFAVATEFAEIFYSAEGGLQDCIQVDQPIFIKWLHSGSTKSRPTGHRRGRPPRISGELSWHKVLLSIHRGRRRDRPPRSVLLLPWSHRPKGRMRGRPPNNYHSLETDPASVFFFIGCPDVSCFLYVLLLLNTDAFSQPELHSISSQGGGGVVKAQLMILQFLCRESAIVFVYWSLSSYEKESSTIEARGVD